ncbi:MAG: transcriptional repressor [Deltaproteobacteria bacterium]|nr:transcriptional repressor [Deltaproteobacteria bacterium]
MAKPSEVLRGSGLKVTTPRRKILEFFETHRLRHLSAEDVYRELRRQGEALSISTTYRVLAQFEQAGLLVRHQPESAPAVYELSRHGTHNHLVCQDCHELMCFVDSSLDEQQKKIAEQHGHELVGYSLLLYTRCQRENCPNRGNRSATKPPAA